jgi:hypothetical protein
MKKQIKEGMGSYTIWKKQLLTGERFKFWAREIWEYKYLILISLVLVTIATILDYVSGTFVTRVGVAVSPDIILDRIGPINLKWIFSYGYLLVVAIFFLYPLFFRIKKFHNVVSQFSLLIALRGIFISMTHLKTPDSAIPIHFPGIIQHLAFENDLFFSGHTAVPFLGFLIYKDSKIRWFFLLGSIVMGATSLLMHRHYSIDVFAAFFITYGSFVIGKKFIRKYEIWVNGSSSD